MTHLSYKAAYTEIQFFLEADDGIVTGLFSAVWEILSSRLNFSVESLSDFNPGVAYSEDNGTGVFGTLLRNEADFSISPLPLTEIPLKTLDYTNMVLFDEWYFISGPPRDFKANHYLSILKCFQNSLWLGILVALLTHSFVWTIMDSLLKHESNLVAILKEYADCVFSASMSLLNQDREFKSDRLYERFYWFPWRLATMLLTWSFLGLMLARLAKKDEPLRYEELKDIYMDKKMKLLLFKNTPPYADISSGLDIVSRSVFERVVKDGTAKFFDDVNLADYVQDMTDGKIVLAWTETSFLLIAKIYCEQLAECDSSKRPFATDVYTLFMNKNLDWRVKKIIKFTANLLLEKGLVQFKYNTLNSLGRLCLSSTRPLPSDEPLTIENFYVAAFFYACFISLSVCALCAEVLKYSRRKRRYQTVFRPQIQ